MYIEEKQLKDFLLDSGLVSKQDVLAAYEEAVGKKTSVGSVLVSQGKLSEDDLRKMQGYILGVPFVDLKNEHLDREILSLIPEPIARSHNIVAFKRSSDTLEVAMTDTDDLAAIDFIKKKVKLRILARLTDSDSIKSALLQYQKSLKAEFGDIIQKEAEKVKALTAKMSVATGETDLKKMAEELPVIGIVDALLKHAILQNASDIHIEPTDESLLIRYRIDGLLHDAMILPKESASSIIARVKVLAQMKLDEKRLPQDGRFAQDLSGENVSYRVSLIPTYHGEKAVLRVLRENAAGFTLEKLGFHGEGLESLHQALKASSGLILTTGPTGSGKTTTLYTMMDILNTPDVNISTVEDPIEYQMKRINQTQVKPEIGFTFASGLRTLVRQDPDIIMVGEIRDVETAGLAINAALTGHLVLSTLHTSSAATSFPRLADMKAEPFLVASTVNVAIAQRLVRRLAEIKQQHFLSSAEIESIGKHANLDLVLSVLKKEQIIGANLDWDKIPFYKSKPSRDSEDGYKGRVVISEVLKVTNTIRDLIVKLETADTIEKQAREEGMMTMLEDGLFKAAEGITTIEEVLRTVSSE